MGSLALLVAITANFLAFPASTRAVPKKKGQTIFAKTARRRALIQRLGRPATEGETPRYGICHNRTVHIRMPEEKE